MCRGSSPAAGQRGDGGATVATAAAAARPDSAATAARARAGNHASCGLERK